MLKYVAEISDPIHRYVYLSEVERDIIDSRIFQRLRRIRQLAGAHLTYPSAQHTRFEHSLGVMHLAGKAGEVLSKKGYIHEDKIELLRLAALLHDIGHGPFSHLFEEVVAEKSNATHEDIGRRIIEKEMSEILSRYGFSSSEVSDLSFGHSATQFLNEVISGVLSVDVMDYLPRDSYFTGAEYGKVDSERLISSFEVHDERLALDRSALYSFESLMISRYQMFKAVYFHKTVRSAEVMLLRSMLIADEKLNLTESVKNIDYYLSLTDDTMLHLLLSSDLELAAKLARDYMERRLLKCVFERIMHRKDRIFSRIFNRRMMDSLANEIAEKADVEPESVYVDASRAPSVPLTPSKEEPESIMLIGKESDGKRIPYTLKMGEIPLIGSISGFMDMIRVYTIDKNRQRVEDAVKKVLGESESWYERVSM